MCNKKFSKSVPLEGMPNRAKRSNYGPSPPDPQRRPCTPRRRLSPWRAGPRPPTMCPTSLLGLDVDPPWMNITWWQSLTLDFTSSSVLWSPSSSSLWWITLRDKYLLKKEVVHLRAKTFDLVSGLTKGSWAFSGSVTALVGTVQTIGQATQVFSSATKSQMINSPVTYDHLWKINTVFSWVGNGIHSGKYDVCQLHLEIYMRLA